MAFNVVAQIQLQAPGNLNQVTQQIQSQLQNINASIKIQIPSGVQAVLTQLNTGITNLNANLTRLTGATNSSNTALTALQNTLTASNAALNQTATSAAKTGSSVIAASNAMEEFGRVAGVAGRRFLGFTVIANSVISAFNAISNSVKSALDFEREFIKLTQVGEAYRSELTELRSEIDRLSRSFGTSSQELLESSVTLRQAGYSVREVTQALEALSKASLSPSFGNFKELSEGLISIRSQFRITANEVEGAFSSINAVSNAYAVESKDILQAIQRTGGAFRSVGGDLNEFISIFTSVRSTTRESAESIATGLRTIFTRLQRPELVENLKAMGINLRYTRDEAVALGNVNLEQQFIGAYQSVQRLSAALQGIPSTDPRYAKIVEELGGYRQISKVIPLLQEFTTAQNALNIAQSSGASLTVSADQAQQNFLVNINKIKESFLALTRTLVNSAGFQVFLDSIIKVGNVAVSIFDKISPLIPLFVTLGAIKFGANIGSFLSGVTQGLQGIGPKRYATGGPVSGSGVSDTVPALLTPGEHVLNRRQVYNMGGHAQVQRYADAGLVTFRGGNKDLTREDLRLLFRLGFNPQKVLDSDVDQAKLKFLLEGIKTTKTYEDPTTKGGSKATEQIYNLLGLKNFSAFSGIPGKDSGGRQLDPTTGIAKAFAFKKELLANRGNSPIVPEYEIDKSKLPGSADYKKQIGQVLQLPLPGDDLGLISTGGNKGVLDAGATFTTLSQSYISGKGGFNKTIQDRLKAAKITRINALVTNYVSSNQLNQKLDEKVSTMLGSIRALGLVKDNSLNVIRGIVYQDALLQGKVEEGGYGIPPRGSLDALDFVGPPSTIDKGLRSHLFPNFRSNYADIKHTNFDNTYTPDVVRKYINHLVTHNDPRLPFANGGVVPGSGNYDSVPADLAPGSFVIKKASAEAIGHGNLAKFATGGPVGIPTRTLLYNQAESGRSLVSIADKSKFASNVAGPGFATGILEKDFRMQDLRDTASQKLIDAVRINLSGDRVEPNSRKELDLLTLQARREFAVASVKNSQAKEFAKLFGGNILSEQPHSQLAKNVASFGHLGSAGYVLPLIADLIHSQDGNALLRELPQDADFLGAGVQALALNKGNDVFRLARFNNPYDPYIGNRPNIPGILQSTGHAALGNLAYEKLPLLNVLAHDPEYSIQDKKIIAQKLKALIEQGGYIAHDAHQGNIGFNEQGQALLFDLGFLEKGKTKERNLPSTVPLAVRRAGGGSIVDDLFATDEERIAKRAKNFINKFYGKSGVDLTKGIREIKAYNPLELNYIFGRKPQDPATHGFFQGDSGVLGINIEHGDLERTLLHEGIHGLDYYSGKLQGSAKYASEDKGPLRAFADTIGQFISSDLQNPKVSKQKRDYLSDKAELVAFSGQQILGQDPNYSDNFSSAIPEDKRVRLASFSNKKLLPLLRSLTGSITDIPLENKEHAPTLKNIRGLGTSLFKFADGGQSPRDTVPALLTPGEFVFTPEAAQSIGYDRLNEMNQTGQVRGYAGGGRVHLAYGGPSYGQNQPNPNAYQQAQSQFIYGTSYGGRFPANLNSGFIGPQPPGSSYNAQLINLLTQINQTLQRNVVATTAGTAATNNATNSANTTQSKFDRFSLGLTLLGGVITTAAGYIADAIDKSAGTAENAIGGGTEGGFIGKKRFAGGIQGGLVGGGLAASIVPSLISGGAIGGPVGALLAGGLVLGGAAYGAVSSGGQASSELAAARLERSQRNLSDITGIIGQRGNGQINPDEFNSIKEAIASSFASIRDKAIADNTHYLGLFGVSQGAASEQERTGRRAFVQQNSAEFNKILTDFINLQGREAGRSGETAEQLRARFSTGGAFQTGLLAGPQGELIRTLAQLPGQSVGGITSRLATQATQSALAEKAKEAQNAALIERDKGLTQFERLADSVSRVATEMDGLKTVIELVGTTFEGRIAGSKFSFGARGNTRFGIGDAGENAASITGVSRGLGSASGQFSEYLTAFDAIKRSLFTQVSTRFNANSTNFDRVGFAEQIRDVIQRDVTGGTRPNQSQASIIGAVYANLQALDFEQLKQKILSGDISGLNNELLKGVDAVSQFSRIIQDTEKIFNDINGLLSEYQRRQIEVGVSQDRLVTSTNEVSALEAKLPFLQRGISPVGLQGQLSVEQQNSPLLERLKRLTGLGANAENPVAVGNLQSDLNRQIREISARRDAITAANPRDTAAFPLFQQLTDLQRRSAEAGLALKDLADASTRNKVAQEQLTEVNREQSNRVRFAEGLLTGGIGTRVQLASGLRSYNNVLRQGTDIANLPSPITADIFRALRGIGDIPVNAFGANEAFHQRNAQRFNLPIETVRGFTGNQVADELIKGSPILAGFANPQNLDQKRNELLQQIVTNTNIAQEANRVIVTEQRTLQETFFTRIGSLQEQFFAKMEVLFNQDALNKATAERSILQGQRGTAVRERNVSNELRALGLTSQSQVEILNRNRPAIETYSQALSNVDIENRRLVRYTENRNNVLTDTLGGVDIGRNRAFGRDKTGLTSQTIEQLVASLSNLNLTADTQRRLTTDLTALRVSSGNAPRNIDSIRHDIEATVANVLRYGGRTSSQQTVEETRTLFNRLFEGSGVNARGVLDFTANQQNRETIGQFTQQNPIEGAQARLTTLNARLEASRDSLDSFSAAINLANLRISNFSAYSTTVNTARQAGVVGNAIGNGLFGGFGAIGGVLAQASGGLIPGTGSSDTVPAMLTPGEFVINAGAASRIGLANLNALNRVQHFADGGPVSAIRQAYNDTISAQQNGPLILAMNNFTEGLDPFIDAIKAFPHELTGNFNHTVNVNFNGGEFLTSLEPTIKNWIEEISSEQLSRYIETNMPEAGRPQ